MALTYDGTNGITFNDGTQMGTANALGMRNRIINGAMNINQRGWSGTISSNGTYTLDRLQAGMSQSSKFSVQQNASPTAPAPLPCSCRPGSRTGSWPGSGSSAEPRKKDGNTLGYINDDNLEVSQHFFALKLILHGFIIPQKTIISNIA